MNKSLSQLIRSTKEYSDVCDTCKDEILIYPTISGRTEYSQDEVEQITLKRIIDKLQSKEQECKALKKRVQGEIYLGNKFKEDFAEQAAIAQKLEQALDEIEKFMIYEFSGQNQWVKKNVLNIINKAKGESVVTLEEIE